MVIFLKAKTHAFLNLWSFEYFSFSLLFLPSWVVNKQHLFLFFIPVMVLILTLNLFNISYIFGSLQDCLGVCSHALSIDCQTPAACCVAS